MTETRDIVEALRTWDHQHRDWRAMRLRAAEHIEALQEEVDRLRDSEEREVVGWQPIETAPWSGPPVLLWRESTQEHYVAARIRGAHGPGWCTPDGFQIFRATHWMPLPAGPAVEEEEE